MIDTNKLKCDYPPSYVLESVVGLNQVGGSGEWKRYDYGSGRPALVCNDSTGYIVDHHKTPISPDGGNSTDVIGFVQTHYGVDFMDAVGIISSANPSEYNVEELQPPKPVEKPSYPISKLREWNRNLLSMGMHFLEERCISESYAKMAMLGYRYKRESGKLKLESGKKFNIMDGWRVVFPTVRTKPRYDLIRINQRLDSFRATQTLRNMDQKTLDLLSELGDEKDIIDALWRDKYLSKGPLNEPFQSWTIKRWNGVTWWYPHMEILLITEGEIDAINLFESSGPAVPAKKALVNNAEMIVVVGDNGGDGPTIANSTLESFVSIGQEARIVYPYPEYKDVNDMTRAGVIHQWLKENNLPIKKGLK